ncbi:CBS domain-containing protein [Tunturiibacter gelidiferens]|uniref:CBS domain-containing protein n=1 Tax=Tunturiibacter gelidiferens TaxID=3069689 RepID=UPI003D9B071F
MHFRTVALSLGGKGESALTLRQVMRELTVVPETKLAIELLQEFQERRRHIAIVVDEFGSTVGLVTAEDVLEQIVGELEDEFDVSKSPCSAPPEPWCSMAAPHSAISATSSTGPSPRTRC